MTFRKNPGGAEDARISTIEDKYVRSTRFFSISGPATSGTITLPPLSEVVLDDFGGTVDAVISGVDSGRPTDVQIRDNLGAVLATTFDSSGNFVLSGTPVSFPVAIIYRVRQKLVDFDSISTDIIGGITVDVLSSGGQWGSIGGTLSDQTDLQNALDAKENTSNKGVSNGYSPLDGDAFVPDANISNIVKRTTQIGFESTPTITNNGDGTVTIIAVDVTVYTSSAKTDVTKKSVGPSTIPLVDNAINFICADTFSLQYVSLSDAGSIDYYQYIPLAEIFRSGANIHTQNIQLHGRQFNERTYERIIHTARYARESGLDGMAVDTSLKLTSLSGVVYAANTEYDINPISPSSRGFFLYRVGGVWTRTSGLNPSLNNTQYDDGTNLQSLGAGQYTINWIFRGIETEDHFYTILSNQAYDNVDLAKSASLPNQIPDLITAHAMLIGRVIIQNGQTTIPVDQIQSAFTTTFQQSSPVTQHNSLAGIQGDGPTTERYHLNQTQHDGLVGGTTTNLHTHNQAPIGLSAANGSFSFSTLTLANSNNVSFSTGTQGVYATASFNQSAQPVAFSAGNGSANFSTLKFADSQGVSFSTGTQGIFATVKTNYLTQQSTQPVAVSAANGSFNFSTLQFANSNNVSFSTGTQGVYATVTTPAQTVQPVAFSAANGSALFSTIQFANSNNVSFSTGTQGIYATVTTPAQTVQTQNLHNVSLSGNTAGVMAQISSGTMIFAGGNNITLSQNGQSVTISGPNVGGAQTGISSIGNSQTTYTSGAVQFLGSNLVTVRSTTGQGFVIDATVAAQSVQTQNLVSIQGSTGAISWSNSNNITFGFNASTITASASFPAQTQYVFSQSNGLTFGTNGSTVTASHNGITSQSIQTQNMVSVLGSTGNISFGNANGVTFGTNGSTITASINPSGGGAALQGSGTYTQNTGTIQFANSNGITFGLSNNGVMTCSVIPGAAAGIGALAADGSTTYTSGTVALYPGNNILMSTGGQSISIHGIVGTGVSATNINATISSNGLQISGHSPEITLSRWAPVQPQNMSTIAHSNATLILSPLYAQNYVSFTRADIFASISFTSNTNTSVTSGTFTFSNALYSWNNSTWSQMVSGSQSYSFSNSSNANTTNYFGVREITSPMATALTPGNYLYAWWIRTSGHTMTIAPLVASHYTNGFSGAWGAATATSAQIFPGAGISSVSFTTGIPTAIPQANIQGNIAGVVRWPIVEFVSDGL